MIYSLRRMLLATLVAAATLIWGLTAYISYREARHEVAELFDAELAQSARVLLALVRSSLDRGDLPEHWQDNQLLKELGGHAPGHKYEKKLAFQLWIQPHRLILRSSSAPLYPLATVKEGFSETTLKGSAWHVFTLQDDASRFLLHVGQRDDIRKELTDDITRQLFIQLLLGIPLLALCIWIIVGRTLSPLKRLTEEVKTRKANRLTPLKSPRIPAEVKPLVDEINELLGRLAQAFEAERRFTADASHELRTPLAGLKTQAQVALRARDEAARRHALMRIQQSVERMAHLVDQLLTLARIDPEIGLSQTTQFDLYRQTASLIHLLEPSARKKNTELILSKSDGGTIEGNPRLIEVLIRNLIDNAIRYTPENGTVKVGVKKQGSRIQLCVEDNGPGIPEAIRGHVFQRFYRGVETAHKNTGSGLGLSIVERIAALHGATIELSPSASGGLRVTVAFPLKSERRGISLALAL